MTMYSEYQGRCKERVLFFLCQIDYSVGLVGKFSADGKTITWGENGPIFCTYSWIDHTDIPVFEFHNRWRHINTAIKSLMTQMLSEERERFKEQDRRPFQLS